MATIGKYTLTILILLPLLLSSLCACDPQHSPSLSPTQSSQGPPAIQTSAVSPEGALSPISTEIESQVLQAPFEHPQLNVALEHLRRHLVGVHTQAPVEGALEDAWSVFSSVDLSALSSRDTPRALLFMRRLFESGEAHPEAAITAAVARIAIPALFDDLSVDLAASLQRGAQPNFSLSRRLLKALKDRPELPRATLLHLSAQLQTSPSEEAAQTLTQALAPQNQRHLSAHRDALCAFAPPLLASKLSPQDTAKLASATFYGCTGKPAAEIAQQILKSSQDTSHTPAATPAQRIFASKDLYTQVKHNTLLKVLAPLRKDASIPLELRCEALSRSAKTYRRSRRSALAVPLYKKVLKDCETLSHWRIPALYSLGLIAFNKGSKTHKASAKHFRDILSSAPTSRYADDAVFFLTRILIAQKKLDEALALVEPTLLGEFIGDMSGDTLWRLFRALEASESAQHRKQAPVLLKQARVALKEDQTYYSAGRVQYAAALKLLEQTPPNAKKPAPPIPPQRLDEAIELLEEVIDQYPLSYYAYQSLSLLYRLPEAPTESARVRWQRQLKSARKAPLSISWKLPQGDPEKTQDLVERALLFSHSGESARAAILLETLPLQTDEEAKTDLLWIIAFSLHLEGHFQRSHDIPRRKIKGWKTSPPSPQNRLLWEIAYPNAYTQIVPKSAQRFKLSPSIILAVMREESAFNPGVESYAHAFGLMQLLFSTGSEVARKHLDRKGITRAQLLNPSLNIPTGAAYLSHLSRKVAPTVPLMAAGYNAGGGGVLKWRRHKDRKDLSLAWFIEAIPSTQTRDYSKRVSSTALIYDVLYSTEDPPMIPHQF